MKNELEFYAVLDGNNIVINYFVIPIDQKISTDIITGESFLYNVEDILVQYPEGSSLQQYSQDDKSITNNTAIIGHSYDSTLNAFVPPCPDETYILDTEDFNWYPDPDLEYELQGDGIMFKWIPTVGWRIVEEIIEE